MMVRAVRYIIYVLSVIWVAGSCELRPLTYDYHPYCTVDLDVDWSEFGELPTGMTAMFYNENGAEPIVHLTNSVHHSQVRLREGRYNVIVFNQSVTEFGSLGFRGMESYETAEVYVTEKESEWYKDEGGKMAGAQPEPFALAVYEGFEVTEEMVDAERDSIEYTKGWSGTKSSLAIVPRSIIVKGDIHILVEGIYNLRSVRATLSGVAEDVRMSTGVAGENGVTHLLEGWSMTQDEDDYNLGAIHNSFSTFGHKGMRLSEAVEDSVGDSSEWEDVKLGVSVLLVDNKTIMDFAFDVADYITVDGTIGKIVLTIDIGKGEDGEYPIVLPDVKPADGNEGGFDATVDDWGDEVNVEVGV